MALERELRNYAAKAKLYAEKEMSAACRIRRLSHNIILGNEENEECGRMRHTVATFPRSRDLQ